MARNPVDRDEDENEKNTDKATGRAIDLIKKAITVGVGAAFLTEESLRAMVSELKLPKELIQGLLSNANQSKNEFLQKLSSDVLERIQSRVDLPALVQEVLEKNEIELSVRIKFHPKKKDEKSDA